MNNIKKVLVVVAHPDDEVLGCGGFLRMLADTGADIHCVYMNNGCNFRADFKAERVRLQIDEVKELLGIKAVTVFQNPSMELDKIHHLELSKAIEEIVNEFRPDTIITHQADDLNRDHRVVNDAVMVASRFKEGSPIKNVLVFPVISSSDISPQWTFQANYFVDISEVFSIKHSAMACYREELASMKLHRGKTGIEIWAQFFGLQANMPLAEPFKIIRGSYV